MFKTTFVLAALAMSNAAFACGGKACAHCDAPAETA